MALSSAEFEATVDLLLLELDESQHMEARVRVFELLPAHLRESLRCDVMTTAFHERDRQGEVCFVCGAAFMEAYAGDAVCPDCREFPVLDRR